MKLLPGVSISRVVVPIGTSGRRPWLFPYFGVQLGRRWYFPIGWGGNHPCQQCRTEADRRYRAEEELARLADVVAMLSGAHRNTEPHRNLDKRVCQACRMFREMENEPSVRAAQQRIHNAVEAALRAGVCGCPPIEEADRG